MTATTVTEDTAVMALVDRGGGSNDDDPFEHLWCCEVSEFTSLCGLDIGDDYDIGDGELAEPCPLCEMLEAAGFRCDRPGCTS